MLRLVVLSVVLVLGTSMYQDDEVLQFPTTFYAEVSWQLRVTYNNFLQS